MLSLLKLVNVKMVVGSQVCRIACSRFTAFRKYLVATENILSVMPRTRTDELNFAIVGNLRKGYSQRIHRPSI